MGLLASLSAYSQESYVPQEGEGIVYFLPKTKVAIDIIATKVDYQPGDFCLYASRYLRLNNIGTKPETHWEIKDIRVRLEGVPDSTNAYIIKLKDKNVASNVELTDKGIVKAINTTSTEKEQLPDYKLETPQPHENASKYMTEDILMAGSTPKMAELTARESTTSATAKTSSCADRPTPCLKTELPCNWSSNSLTSRKKHWHKPLPGSPTARTKSLPYW